MGPGQKIRRQAGKSFPESELTSQTNGWSRKKRLTTLSGNIKPLNNLAPWTQLEAETPVNQPTARWFNAVTTALTTLSVEIDDTITDAQIDRPNTDGSDWVIRIPALSAGTAEHVYQVYQRKADDDDGAAYGFDWVRAHA
jgi:hypothetical protein